MEKWAQKFDSGNLAPGLALAFGNSGKGPVTIGNTFFGYRAVRKNWGSYSRAYANQN